MRSSMVFWMLGPWLLASCGRVGFDAAPPAGEPPDAPPSPIEIELIVTADATDVPAGSSVTLELTLKPEPRPGAAFKLKTDGGVLLGDNTVSDGTLAIIVAADGTLAPVRLHVPVDAAPGATIGLSSDVPIISGDIEYLVKDPKLRKVMVESEPYELARGFVVEHVPMDAAAGQILGNRSGRLAFPPRGSAFGAEPYLALAGMPPEILRLDGESLVSFAVSPGTPDEGVAQIAFADPAGPHGDVLFVCSASLDAGDGIFTVSPGAEWKPWRELNNCNGLAIDHDLVAGDPEVPAPVYANVNSTTLERIHADGVTVETVTTELPFGSSGFALFLNGQPPFAKGLYLVFPGTTAPGEDGLVEYLGDAVAGAPAFEVLADALPGPDAAVFGTGTQLGGLLYLFMGVTGEIHGLRPDGTSFVFMSGIAGPADLAIHPEDRSLWILESGRSHILRVKPELPLPP